MKGVDLVAYDGKFLNLIESKDYRKNSNPPVDHIVWEVVKKFRDTLYGVWCGSICEPSGKIQTFLEHCRKGNLTLQFFFHFESPLTPYPSGFHKSSGAQEIGGARKTKAVSSVTICEAIKRKMGPMKEYVFVTDMDGMRRNPKLCRWQVEEKK